MRAKVWFSFSVKGIADANGVDPLKLARLLEDLSATFWVIAREELTSVSSSSREYRKQLGQALAGVRVLRVRPGSVTIDLTPPPDYKAKIPPQLIGETKTPDDLAMVFYQEFEQLKKLKETPRRNVQRQIYKVLHDAGDIGGNRASVSFRPKERLFLFATSISIPKIEASPLKTKLTAAQHRRLSGKVYMVDVEPGREKLRIKLPTGRDVTIEASESLRSQLEAAISKVIEVEVEEGGEHTRALAHSLQVLPSTGEESDKPPLSVAELAEQQGIPSAIPDYQVIVSDIWRNQTDIERFEKHLHEVRYTEPPA